MVQRLTGMFSVLPSAVINEDQNPSTPTGRCVGDMVIETLRRTSEMFRTLPMKETLFENVKGRKFEKQATIKKRNITL